MVFHAHAAAASPSCWVIRQWHCHTGKFPRGIWHWDQFQEEPGHSVPHPNTGLGFVSPSGHRSPAPAAFACAQAQDQARVPLRDGG